MTRLAYIGNFGVSHSTETHYARAFEANGCEVERWQEDRPEDWGGIHGDLDFLLYTRTWDTPDAGAMVRSVRSFGIPTVAVHLDIWRGLDRQHQLTEQSMFECDHVFTADGDNDETWERLGVNHHWLRPGVVEDECKILPPEPTIEGRWDVAFVGSYNYHPEWPTRPAVIDHLREWYGERFVHVGGDGEYPGTGHALRGDDLNRFYSSVPVVVGDSCFAHLGSRYWSDRAYEAPGRGAFQIFPRIQALWDELGGYPHYAVGDWDDLHRAVDYWLDRPEARESSRRWTHSVVASRCTYTQRAAEILDVIGVR